MAIDHRRQRDADRLGFRRGIAERGPAAMQRRLQERFRMLGIGEARIGLSKCCFDRGAVQTSVRKIPVELG